MADSGDAFRKQHKIPSPTDIDPDKDVRTPEDQDDDFLENAEEGDEDNTDVDRNYRRETGDEDGVTIGDAVNKDEEARARDLIESEEEPESEE